MNNEELSLNYFTKSQFRSAAVLCTGRIVLPPEEVSKKSCAQVETSVGQNVLQKSCELRSRKERQKAAETVKSKYPPPLRVRYPTYEERASVVRAAKEAGFKSVSHYLRELSRGPNYKPPRDHKLTQALLRLNRELTAQGNNLNQIARQLNGNAMAPDAGENMLDVLGRSMLRTHKAVRSVLADGQPEP